MHRPVGAKALQVVLLLLIVLAFLPLQAGAQRGMDVDPEQTTHERFFPIAFRGSPPDLPAPDLVVEAITVNSDSAVVVIKNQGGAPADHLHPFWVDLYIAPDPMPTAPNEVWDRSCTQGIVWGVSQYALPLNPGETLTMTYCPEQDVLDPLYVAAYSKFVIPLDIGTQIAVQVDSANMDTTYGGVREEHEILGQPYNNISTTTSIAGSGCGTVQPERTFGLLPLVQSDSLPPRARRAE